ncbi:MAG: acyl-CoA thioesterase [Chryseobacterium sp.]|nr:MAG: acyl-CoA thioesterase [Chryseobacterium sp.]
MNLELKKQLAETRVFKVVFPKITNHHNTMFGGTVMEMMDEVAFMTATRFCRKPIVTVSSDKIDFKKPIPSGSLVELIGNITRVGTTSVTVQVDIFLENMYAEGREKAVSGQFSLVAVDENMKPVPIFAEVSVC